MNIPEINRLFASAEQQALLKTADRKATSGNRKDRTIYRALIQARGERLAARYLACARGFSDIFAQTGYTFNSQSREYASNEIVIDRRTSEFLGSGALVATVTTPDKVEELLKATTSIVFKSDNGKVVGVTPPYSENFWSVGFYFGGGHKFLHSDYKWVGPRDGMQMLQQSAYNLHDVETRDDDIGQSIFNAEQTIQVLQEAINNHDLNPRYTVAQ